MTTSMTAASNPRRDDVYRASIEEYRFQAQFNWSRTQYLLAFNAAILASATAVAATPGRGAALVFLAGVVTAFLSGFVVKTQHGYYRAARDRLKRIEAHQQIPEDEQVNTTTSMGGPKRLVSVNVVVYLLLVTIAVSDLVGFSIILAR